MQILNLIAVILCSMAVASLLTEDNIGGLLYFNIIFLILNALVVIIKLTS